MSPLLQMPKRGHMRAVTEDDCPAVIARLIEQCLEDEPWKRPSAKQIFDVIKVSQVCGGSALCSPFVADDWQVGRCVPPNGLGTGDCVDWKLVH